MNGPLFLENSFGKLGRVLPVFTEKKNSGANKGIRCCFQMQGR